MTDSYVEWCPATNGNWRGQDLEIWPWGACCAVGSETVRLEQAIALAREIRSCQETELAGLSQELDAGLVRLEPDGQLLAQLDEALAQGEPELAETQVALAERAAGGHRLRLETEWDRPDGPSLRNTSRP